MEDRFGMREGTGRAGHWSAGLARAPGAGLAERLAAAHLRRLARGAAGTDAAAEADLLGSVGWLVACREEARLPVDVAARLVPGSSTHPMAQSLARFLLMRSVRCRRVRQAYLDQARVMLHLQREKSSDDFRPALWLGALHLLEGRLSEAHRAFEAAQRLAPGEPCVELALGLGAVALGEVRSGSRRRSRVLEAAGWDPVLAALVRSRWQGGTSKPADEPVTVILPVGTDGTEEPEAAVEVRATAGRAVLVRGPGGQRLLTPLEGELLLALLSLSSQRPSGAAVARQAWEEERRRGAGGPAGIRRERWVAAIWPSTPGAVGRMDSLFSAAIRSLRAKALAAARRPLVEVLGRGLYGFAPGASVQLVVDLSCAVADWLLARTGTAPAGREPPDQTAPASSGAL